MRNTIDTLNALQNGDLLEVYNVLIRYTHTHVHSISMRFTQLLHFLFSPEKKNADALQSLSFAARIHSLRSRIITFEIYFHIHQNINHFDWEFSQIELISRVWQSLDSHINIVAANSCFIAVTKESHKCTYTHWIIIICIGDISLFSCLLCSHSSLSTHSSMMFSSICRLHLPYAMRMCGFFFLLFVVFVQITQRFLCTNAVRN